MGVYCTNLKEQRIGETVISNQGELMTIVNYTTANDLWVEFADTGYRAHGEYAKFKKGSIRDPLYPSIYGIAYFGIGAYTSNHPAYRKWFDMLRRCYDPATREQYRTYQNVEVCAEWLNYQNFAAWNEYNHPAAPPEIEYELDKDILQPGNKIYSPGTCSFVPREINLILSINEAIRGNCPVGVSEIPNRPGKYAARLVDNYGMTGGTYLLCKTCDSKEEAFELYKEAKRNLIRYQADKFNDVITPAVYDALLRWEPDFDF